MSTEVTMTVANVVQMRDHMNLALTFLDEGQIAKVRYILESYRDHATDILGRV